MQKVDSVSVVLSYIVACVLGSPSHFEQTVAMSQVHKPEVPLADNAINSEEVPHLDFAPLVIPEQLVGMTVTVVQVDPMMLLLVTSQFWFGMC